MFAIEYPPSRSEDHSPACTVEQLNVQLAFQGVNLLRYGTNAAFVVTFITVQVLTVAIVISASCFWC